MDKAKQLGKYLYKSNEKASNALKKQFSEYGKGDSARDIFDFQVPFQMHFRTPRKGTSVSAHLQFEYPPPDSGLGRCCADCYCAICEQFIYTDVEDDQTILLSHPYVEGSVRVYDTKGTPNGISETDPEAGIIDLNYTPATDATNYITVCYIHRYAPNCTGEPAVDPCGITDTFTRTIADGWGTSDAGVVWSLSGSGISWSCDGNLGVATWGSGAPNAILTTTYGSTLSLRCKVWFSGWTYGGSDGYALWRLQITGPNRNLYLNPGSNFGFSDPNGYISMDGGAAVSFDWVPSTWYSIHIEYDQISGLFQANIWLDGTTEPATWMFDSGSFPGDSAITDFRFRGQNNPFTFTAKIDDLDISGINSCAISPFDNFNRTLTGSWGTSIPSLLDWYIAFDHTNVGVIPGSAYVDISSTPYNEEAQIIATSGYFTGSFIMTTSWSFDTTLSSTKAVGPVYFVTDNGGANSLDLAIDLSSDADWSSISLGVGATSVSTLLPTITAANTIINVKWEVTIGTLARVKIWWDSLEPEEWTLTNNTAPSALLRNRFNIRLDGSGSPAYTGRISQHTIYFS